MEQDINQKLASLEALLFIHGEPVALKKVSEVLAVETASLEELLTAYEARLAAADRGLALLRIGERVQLVTKPAFGNILEAFVKAELSEELTPASLEALAIIAYFGPITRARIDYQRGVNSSFILRSLLLRGLVERTPDPFHAQSYCYTASAELLRHLGIARADDLPQYGEFRGALEKIEAAGAGDAAAVVGASSAGSASVSAAEAE